MDVLDFIRRRETAEERLERLDGEIAAAVVDRRDERLRSLRAERAGLREDVQDLAAAEALRTRREAAAAAEERRTRINAARARARDGAEALHVLAQNVDEILTELEAAFVAYEEQSRELAGDLREGGLPDGGRIARQTPPSLRWATYLGAPRFAAAADVPRIPVNRRRSMAESALRVVPAIEEESK